MFWDAVTGATGYKVFCGTQSGIYDDAASPLDVGNVLTVPYCLGDGATRYFAVAGYDGDGDLGALSQEIELTPAYRVWGPVGYSILRAH